MKFRLIAEKEGSYGIIDHSFKVEEGQEFTHLLNKIDIFVTACYPSEFSNRELLYHFTPLENKKDLE